MHLAESVHLLQQMEWQVDFNPEIGAALANCHANAAERQARVLFTIASYDVRTLTPHQFIDAHVIEVAAVGYIDVAAIGIRQTEQFPERVDQTERRLLPLKSQLQR